MPARSLIRESVATQALQDPRLSEAMSYSTNERRMPPMCLESGLRSNSAWSTDQPRKLECVQLNFSFCDRQISPFGLNVTPSALAMEPFLEN